MHCDNWECPIPPVPNCYLDRDVCDNATEWCMVETHEKWGQWAMGQNGATPEFGVEERCGQHYDDLINKSAEELNLDASKVDELRSSRNAICNSTRVGVTAGMQLTDQLADSSGYRTWMPSRGKCVKYRQEGQSCIQTQSRTGSFKGTRGGHPWIVSFDEGNATGVGNPFYVPYETSVKMWRVDLSEPDLRFYDVKNPKASHNDVHL